MPEQLLYELQVPCLLVDDGRCRVSERVKSRRSGTARHSETIQHWIKDISPQNIGVKRRTVFLTEDEILRSSVVGVLFLQKQRTKQRGSEVDDPDAPLRFRQNQLAFPEGLPDFQCLRFKIDMLPLDTQQFS